MSSGPSKSLDEARVIAEEIISCLSPGCHRIEVAGSIRRDVAVVNDVELVALPIKDFRPSDDIWGTEEAVDLLRERLDLSIERGVLRLHPEDPKRGHRYAKLQHVDSGMQVDLFIADEDRYGVIKLIRTGPAAYSQWLVTEARRRLHHVARGELHPGSLGCGQIPCVPIPTYEESDVYHALRMPFLEPALRM